MQQTWVWAGNAKRATAAAALVAAFTIAVGAGSGRSLTHVGGLPRLIGARGDAGDRLLILIVLLLPVVALIVYSVLPGTRRRCSDEPEHVIGRMVGPSGQLRSRGVAFHETEKPRSQVDLPVKETLSQFVEVRDGFMPAPRLEVSRVRAVS